MPRYRRIMSAFGRGCYGELGASRSRRLSLKSKSHLDLSMHEGWNGERFDGRGARDNAFLPRRNAILAIITLDIAPVCRHEIAEPLVQIAKAQFVEQRQAEAEPLRCS